MEKIPKTEDVDLLLEAAKAAVPKIMDPHPCTVRCFRVGMPMEVGPDGKCRECSRGPTSSSPRMLANLVEERPELVAEVCESFLLMRTLLDHPAVMAAAHAAQSEGKNECPTATRNTVPSSSPRRGRSSS